MSKRTHVYVSTDVEADGPIPGDYSMLSLGSVAFDATGEVMDQFQVNLECLPEACQCPMTMRWWSRQPKAWAACRTDLCDPAEAMATYSQWLRQLPGVPTFVGYPASYDFMFVHWYLIHFTGKDPFGFSALDLKSYAAALLNVPFRDVAKKTMPKSWFGPERHTHQALDDALEQGRMFMRMLRNDSKGHGNGED